VHLSDIINVPKLQKKTLKRSIDTSIAWSTKMQDLILTVLTDQEDE